MKEGALCWKTGLRFVLLVAIAAAGGSSNYTTINLTRIGENGHHGVSVYMSNGSVSNILIDTTQYQLGALQCSSPNESDDCQDLETLFAYPDQITSPGEVKLAVDRKYTILYDCETEESPCTAVNVTLSLRSSEDAEANGADAVPVLLTDQFTADNPALHPVNASHGVLGMGYKSSVSSDTGSAFDVLLEAATNSSSRVFGLDFQSAHSNVSSTMHLGGIAAEYSDSIVWGEQQLRESPLTHNVFIEGLSACGASVFGNWSTTWEVEVDAASTCLVLPQEFYRTLMVWLPVNTTDENGDPILDDVGQEYAVIPAAIADTPLQPIRFRLHAQSSFLYISPADLLLPPSILRPEFQHLGSPLCILKGADLIHKGTYSAAPPQIIFGAKVLQSLYFAADMEAVRAGFANKHDPSEMEGLMKSGLCVPQAVCIGYQKYLESSNTCEDPGCSHYYFMRLNNDDKSCEWKPGAIGTGIFLITALAVCELIVYLVTQYSLSEATSIAIDPVTRYLGSWATRVFDDALLAIKPSLRRRTVPVNVTGPQ